MGIGWDGIGWDGIGWDGIGWDGIGWDGMGWSTRKSKGGGKVECWGLGRGKIYNTEGEMKKLGVSGLVR
jgi:hypothetical protein